MPRKDRRMQLATGKSRFGASHVGLSVSHPTACSRCVRVRVSGSDRGPLKHGEKAAGIRCRWSRDRPKRGRRSRRDAPRGPIHRVVDSSVSMTGLQFDGRNDLMGCWTCSTWEASSSGAQSPMCIDGRSTEASYAAPIRGGRYELATCSRRRCCRSTPAAFTLPGVVVLAAMRRQAQVHICVLTSSNKQRAGVAGLRYRKEA